MKSLVIIEHKNGVLHRMSREAISGAQKIGGDITALVIGENAESVSNELSNFEIEKTCSFLSSSSVSIIKKSSIIKYVPFPFTSITINRYLSPATLTGDVTSGHKF